MSIKNQLQFLTFFFQNNLFNWFPKIKPIEDNSVRAYFVNQLVDFLLLEIDCHELMWRVIYSNIPYLVQSDV